MSVTEVESALTTTTGIQLSAPQRRRLARVLEGWDPARVVRACTPGSPEHEAALEAVVVRETHWFRDEAQLQLVVEELATREPAERTVWIAGCSTGEEVYTLAMLAREAGTWPLAITATDISIEALDATRAANYDAARARGLAPERLARHGRLAGGRWTVDGALRDVVTIARHNLLRDPPIRARVIVCRNVLIYFRPEVAAAVVSAMGAGLAPDGLLVLGHSEGQLPDATWTRARRRGRFVFERSEEVATPPSRRRRRGGADRPDRADREARTDRADRADRPGPGSRAGADRPRRVAQRPVRAQAPERVPGGPLVRPVPPPSDGAPDPDELGALLRAGEAALAVDDVDLAVERLRSARFVAPFDPAPAVLLGLALVRAGNDDAARRLINVARRLLDRPDGDGLHGYPVEVVTTWLDQLEATLA